MSFDSELESFRAYARAMPNNGVYLVDTYNTLDGVRHAAIVGKELERSGHRMAGIRLDSGDLAYLSIEARKILDDAGLTNAQILASNELDEHLIESLKRQDAKITQWGVGTRLVTGGEQSALGGVYKLSAIRESADKPWEYKIKVSEQLIKVSFPGVLQVRRFTRDREFLADMIYSEPEGIADPPTIVDPQDATRQKHVDASAPSEDLLVPAMRAGKITYDPPALDDSRRRTVDQLQHLHRTIRRLVNPHRYPVGLDSRLSELRHELLMRARERVSVKGGGD